MNWHRDFKIAIIERNFTHIEKLIEDIPEFSKKDEIENAMILIDEAKKIISENRSTLKTKMSKIKKTKNFFENIKSHYFESVS